jgi:hypothetical protein
MATIITKTRGHHHHNLCVAFLELFDAFTTFIFAITKPKLSRMSLPKLGGHHC